MKIKRTNKNQSPRKYDEPILNFYKGAYESVFIIFNPFMQVPSDKKYLFDINCTDPMPNDSELIKMSKILTYDDVIGLSGFESKNEIDLALTANIGALSKEHRDKTLVKELETLFEKHNVIEPTEGFICPSIQERVIKSLRKQGYDRLVCFNEFDEDYKAIKANNTVDYDIMDYAGCITDEKNSFLLTIDWDSHFSLLCSSRITLENIVDDANLDGFYCDNSTMLFWSKNSLLK